MTSSIEGASARRVQVAIIVYSRFGVLRQLVEALVEGVNSVTGAEAHVIEVTDQPIDELRAGESASGRAHRRHVLVERLAAADAVIIGAPAYFGSMASIVKRFLEDVLTAEAPPPVDRSRPWHYGVLHDKVGAAFTTSATPHGGNELALHSILTLLMHVGALVVTPGQAEPLLDNPSAPYGATAITGPAGDQPANAEELDSARALGARVARVAAWVRLGRRAFTEPDAVLDTTGSVGPQTPA